jgi:WD40 repeat protein
MQSTRSFHKNHTQEICGVKAYSTYLATGGNDNCVFIYDIRKTEHFLSHYCHEAAVKALDWVVPNVLVSGGGTTDRKIKFWKDGEGIVNEVDTGSQVCGLIASVNSAEVLSCQGFSLNQIIIWNMGGKR